MKQLTKTTTWNNGCGLASMATLIMEKIGASNWRGISQIPVYKQLLSAFSNIYQHRLTWKDINSLKEIFLHPEDQQKIWIPPLRTLLKQVLLQNNDYRDQLFQPFAAAVNRYLDTGELPTEEEYINVMTSNGAYIKQLKREIASLRPQQKRRKLAHLVAGGELSKYWQEAGYPRYCGYVGRAEEGAPMLTAEELSILCRALHIGLTVHSSEDEAEQIAQIDAGVTGYEGVKPLGQLEVRYANNHWEPFVEPRAQEEWELLWQLGSAELRAKNLREVVRTVSAALQKVPANSAALSPSICNFISTKQYHALAQLLQQTSHLGKTSTIKEKLNKGIERLDIPLLLTFFHFNFEARNYLLQHLHQGGHKILLSMLVNYSKRLQTIDVDPSQWGSNLYKVLHTIDNPTEDTPLHGFIREGKTQEAIKAIREGADVHAGNRVGVTPLHLMLGYERVEILQGLIQYRKEKYQALSWYQSAPALDLTVKNEDGDTPLHYAACAKDALLLNIIFDKTHSYLNPTYDFGIQNKNGQTLFHLAAANPHSKILEIFFDQNQIVGNVQKLDVNEKDPLQYAVYYNHVGHAKLLDKLTSTERKKLSFEMALSNGQFDILLALLETSDAVDCLKNVQNEVGLTAVHLAAKLGCLSFLQKVVEKFGKATIFSVKDQRGQIVTHTAAQAGQLPVLKYIFEQGASFTSTDSEGNHPIHLAAANGHEAVVKFLLEQYEAAWKATWENPVDGNAKRFLRITVGSYIGLSPVIIDLNTKNKSNQTPYRLASRNGHWRIADKLRDFVGEDFFDAAIKSIKADDINNLARLVKKEPTIVHEVDHEGNTLFHHLFLKDNIATKQMCITLLEAGADVNAGNKDGKTPLHLLIAGGDWQDQAGPLEEILSLLISKGAKIHAVDKKGLTPLHCAAVADEEKAIDALIKYGANVDYVTGHGLTPLHVAVLTEKLVAFNTLLRHNANIDSYAYPSALSLLFKGQNITEQNISSLWLAFQAGKTNLIKRIVDIKLQKKDFKELGVIRNSKRDNLLHYFAESIDNDEDLKYLRNLQPTISLYDRNAMGWSPLHVACARGYLPVVQQIVELGGENALLLEQTTDEGKTPWLIASEHNHPEVMEYLVAKGAQRVLIPHKKNLLKKTINGISKHITRSKELEQTAAYQYTNTFFQLVVPTLNSYTYGPISMGFQLAQQLALYSSPAVMGLGTQFYYSLKPYMHNHAPWWMERSLDSVATMTSFGVSSAFFGMRVADYLHNPTRRLSGLLASHMLLYFASFYTDSKEWQAIAYVAGRELGMLAADAYRYQSTKPLSSENLINPQLEDAIMIWRGILGPGKGDKFAESMYQLINFRTGLYSIIGPASEVVYDSFFNGAYSVYSGFGSYIPLTTLFGEIAELLSPFQGAFLTPTELFQKAIKLQKEVSFYRDKFLQDLEQYAVERIVPEGNYRAYAVEHIRKVKATLLASKKLEAEDELEIAKAADKKAKDNLALAQEHEKALCQDEKATEWERKLAQERRIKLEAEQLDADAKLKIAQDAYVPLKDAFEAELQHFHEARAQTPRWIKGEALTVAQDKQFAARIAVEIQLLEIAQADATQPAETQAAAKAKLSRLQQDLDKSTEELKLAEKDYFTVVSSHAKAAYEKSATERDKSIEEEISVLKMDANDKYVKFTDYKDLEGQVAVQQKELDQYNAIYEKDKAEYEKENKRLYNLKTAEKVDIKSLVNDALKSGDPINYILDYFEGTGVIDRKDATDRMASSINTIVGSNSRNRKKNLEEYLDEQWNLIFNKNGKFANSVKSSVDKKRIKMDDSKTKQEEAQKKFDDLQSKTEAAKSEYTKLLTQEQLELFNRSNELVQMNYDVVAASSKVAIKENEYLIAQRYHDKIQTKIYQIDHPQEFNATTLVDWAIKETDDDSERARLIILGFVATGIIDQQDAYERMFSSLVNTQHTHSQDKKRSQLINCVQDHWKAITQGDYRQNYINELKRSAKVLDKAKEKLEQAEKEFKELETKQNQALKEYNDLLSDEERKNFSEKWYNQQKMDEHALWQVVHPTQERYSIITLVGQPKLAMDFMRSESWDKIERHQQTFFCDTAAELLVNYKYLFLDAPSQEQKQAEQKSLAAEFKKSPFNESQFNKAKQQIDKDISEGLLQASVKDSLACLGSKDDPKFLQLITSDVNNHLLRALSTNDTQPIKEIRLGDSLLVDQLSPLVAAEDFETAGSLITQVLQQNTTAVSKSNKSKWEPPPPAPFLPDPAPNVEPPKKRHGVKKLWDEGIKPGIGSAVQGAVDKVFGRKGDQPTIFGLSTQGPTLALPGQEPVVLYPFDKPQPKPLFEITPKELTPMPSAPQKTPSTLDKETQTSPSKSVSVVGKSWEQLPPTPTIVFNKNPKSQASHKQPATYSSPVLSTSAYLPSLTSAPSQPMIYRNPPEGQPTPTIIFPHLEAQPAKAQPTGSKGPQKLTKGKSQAAEPMLASQANKPKSGMGVSLVAQPPKLGVPVTQAALSLRPNEPFAVNWLMTWVPESSSGFSKPFYEVAEETKRSNSSTTSSLPQPSTPLSKKEDLEQIKNSLLQVPKVGRGKFSLPHSEVEEILAESKHLPPGPDVANGETKSSGVGEAVLDFFIPPAHGFAPALLLVPEVAAALGIGGGLAMWQWAKTRQDPTSTFPLFKNDDWGFGEPSEVVGFNGYSFPPSRANEDRTGTPINPPTYLPAYRKQNDTERPHRPDPDKKYVPAPKGALPGFPDAERTESKTPMSGGKKRPRWETSGGKLLEWDYQHGELEMYDKRGKHLGAFDPQTGDQVKQPNKSRNIKKFL